MIKLEGDKFYPSPVVVHPGVKGRAPRASRRGLACEFRGATWQSAESIGISTDVRISQHVCVQVRIQNNIKDKEKKKKDIRDK